MAAVHPEYGFAETPAGRDGMLKTAVECGNDEGTLTEETWSRAEVYDSADKLEKTQWSTHYSYVKSKVEQEKAAVAEADLLGLDLRVVVPGNLVVGPVASKGINGTMTRLRDVVTGTNTLKGAADLAVVHVADVVTAHAKCMLDSAASGRYIIAADMVQIEDVFAALREMYPSLPIAALENQDIAAGGSRHARKIDSRSASLGLTLKPYKEALKDAVDSMIAHSYVATSA